MKPMDKLRLEALKRRAKVLAKYLALRNINNNIGFENENTQEKISQSKARKKRLS